MDEPKIYVEKYRPTIWKPKSIYYVVNPGDQNLLDHYIVDSTGTARKVGNVNLSNISNRVDDLEKIGWGSFNNDLHTLLNPFNFFDGVEFTMPLRFDSGLQDQAPLAVVNLIDNATNGISVTNLNDVFLLRIEFKIRTDVAGRKGVMNFDISIPQRFNPKKFEGPSIAGVYEDNEVLFMFFQKETFQANQGFIKATINGNGQIYNVISTPFKLRHGQNL